MDNMIEMVRLTWQAYWNGSGYPYLLAAALLILLWAGWRRWRAGQAGTDASARNSQTLTAIYALLVLAAFAFPASAWVMQKCIGADVYWRVLWTVPVVPLIACAAARLLAACRGSWKKRLLQAELVLCMAGVIAVAGKSVYEGNYQRVHNFQQVPDEVAHVCNLVNADRGDGEALLATDNNLSPYIRVYDPSIQMIYGRLGRGAETALAKKIYKGIHAGPVNYGKVARRCRKCGVNYLVICVYSEEDRSAIEGEGYELLDYVNQYGVFALRQ